MSLADTTSSALLLAAALLLCAINSASAKPVYKHLPHPSPDEIETGLNDWAAKHPDALKVEIAGRTAEDRPLLVCRVTDYRVPDEDKQVALLTACHAGGELNACTGLLRLTKWLIGDDSKAREIRKRQIVLIMPCLDPDGYARQRVGNTLGGNPYFGCWDWNGVVNPEKNPEAVALKSVMDAYQPDVHVDVHGVWMDESTMWESTGMSWAAGLCRSYIPEIPQLMNEAAEKAGFLITMGEQSAGQIRATAPVPGAEHHFYLQHPGVNDCVFSYFNYHSIPLTMEGGFEESIVIRLKRLLEIGNEKWRGECYPGYPANQIACWTSMAVAAWGDTAQKRRKSRVELWRKLPQLRYGCAHPEPRGTMMAFCATTPEGASLLADKRIESIAETLKGNPDFDAEEIARFVDTTPAVNAECSGAGKAEGASPIENGLAIRLLIPYRKAKITHLRLNGRPVEESPTDGYVVYRNPGSIVQVNVPPGEVKDLHIVTCAYDPGENRRAGFTAEDW